MNVPLLENHSSNCIVEQNINRKHFFQGFVEEQKLECLHAFLVAVVISCSKTLHICDIDVDALRKQVGSDDIDAVV